MPGFESTPQTKTPAREKSPQELQELAEQKREKELKVTDRRAYLGEAVEQTERELAWKGFAALSQRQKTEVIFQLFKEKRLPKPEPPSASESPRDNVVDINQYRESKQSEGQAKAANPETKPAVEPEPPPMETAPPVVPEKILPRWKTNLDPYFDKLEALDKKIKAAKGRDSLNIELSPLNPLGRALNNPKETYAPLRQEALDLLKDFRTAAQIERMLAPDAATKKKVRVIENDIEQEISKLKAELNKLEHLRHPLRSAKNAARSLRDSLKGAL